MGITDNDGQSDRGQARQIVNIVADEGHLFKGQTHPSDHLIQGAEFILTILNALNIQFATARRNDGIWLC